MIVHLSGKIPKCKPNIYLIYLEDQWSLQGEHSLKSLNSQGQKQPQLGQGTFLLEIEVSISNIFCLTVIIMISFIISSK